MVGAGKDPGVFTHNTTQSSYQEKCGDVSASRGTPEPARRSRSGPERRSLAPSHKQALAQGRAESAIVNRYLLALGTTKRRGRPLSKERMTRRFDAAHRQLAASTGLAKLVAAQEIRDLKGALDELAQRDPQRLRSLEDAFVRVARRFSERRGISYEAWREVGVPAAILRRAKVARRANHTNRTD